MSTETATKRSPGLVADEAGRQAYYRYVPEAQVTWGELTMEERLAWRHVADAGSRNSAEIKTVNQMAREESVHAQEKAPEPEQPKSLGQIAYEGYTQNERSFVAWDERFQDSFRWQGSAQAVAVAVLHMRYDEMTPELKAAADEGTARGTAWINRVDGPASREDKVRWAMDEPIMDALRGRANDFDPLTVNAIHLAISHAVLAGLKAWYEATE